MADGRCRPRPDLAERNRSRATHGLSGTPTRKSWEAMIRRCTVSSDKDFGNYGGQGIRVCDRWRYSFRAFVADMGIKPIGTSIGRIDNNGDYEPANCRWETATEQGNNRRSTRLLTAHGRTQSISEWAKEVGIGKATLRLRLDHGWPIDAALSTPVSHANRRAN